MSKGQWRRRGRLRIVGPSGGEWVQFRILSWHARMRTLVIAADTLPINGGVNQLRTEDGQEALVIHQGHHGWQEPQTGTVYHVEPIYDPKETNEHD